VRARGAYTGNVRSMLGWVTGMEVLTRIATPRPATWVCSCCVDSGFEVQRAEQMAFRGNDLKPPPSPIHTGLVHPAPQVGDGVEDLRLRCRKIWNVQPSVIQDLYLVAIRLGPSG
jgi:hypothetical protein